MLSLREDFENFSTFKPRPFQEKMLAGVLDQVVAWSDALKTLRESESRAAAE